MPVGVLSDSIKPQLKNRCFPALHDLEILYQEVGIWTWVEIVLS